MSAPITLPARLAAMAALGLFAAAAGAANGVTPVGAGINRSPEGMYGNCARIGPGFASGLGSKRDIAAVSGRDPSKAEAIDVLSCGLFNGGGGSFEVTCPVPGYTYCAESRNDGLGNRILVGVVVDTTPPTCRVVGRRQGPWQQLDVQVRDIGTGIRSIEFREGVTNAVLQEYETLDRNGIIVVTATKEDPDRPAEINAFFATDGAQNTTLCGPFPF